MELGWLECGGTLRRICVAGEHGLLGLLLVLARLSTVLRRGIDGLCFWRLGSRLSLLSSSSLSLRRLRSVHFSVTCGRYRIIESGIIDLYLHLVRLCLNPLLANSHG